MYFNIRSAQYTYTRVEQPPTPAPAAIRMRMEEILSNLARVAFFFFPFVAFLYELVSRFVCFSFQLVHGVIRRDAT